MTRLLILLALVGCKDKEPATAEPPVHHEDRKEPATAAPKLVVEAVIDGVSTKWESDAFAKVPRSTGKNNGGEARDLWSLREMAHGLVGPTARVVSVTGAGVATPIEQKEWDDATKTPVLQVTRRGTLKFRWTDADGKWGEAEVKDVTRLEITR